MLLRIHARTAARCRLHPRPPARLGPRCTRTSGRSGARSSRSCSPSSTRGRREVVECGSGLQHDRDRAAAARARRRAACTASSTTRPGRGGRRRIADEGLGDLAEVIEAPLATTRSPRPDAAGTTARRSPRCPPAGSTCCWSTGRPPASRDRAQPLPGARRARARLAPRRVGDPRRRRPGRRALGARALGAEELASRRSALDESGLASVYVAGSLGQRIEDLERGDGPMRGTRLWIVIATRCAARPRAGGCRMRKRRRRQRRHEASATAAESDLGLITEGTLFIGLDTPYPAVRRRASPTTPTRGYRRRSAATRSPRTSA